jgi:hypothetical protein
LSALRLDVEKHTNKKTAVSLSTAGKPLARKSSRDDISMFDTRSSSKQSPFLFRASRRSSNTPAGESAVKYQSDSFLSLRFCEKCTNDFSDFLFLLLFHPDGLFMMGKECPRICINAMERVICKCITDM